MVVFRLVLERSLLAWLVSYQRAGLRDMKLLSLVDCRTSEFAIYAHSVFSI